MTFYSRRHFLSDLGALSTFTALGSSVMGCKQTTMPPVTPQPGKPPAASIAATLTTVTPATTDLCLIFPGAWLFNFVTDPTTGVQHIEAVTPDCMDHTYLLGASPGSNTSLTQMNQGDYTVAVSYKPVNPGAKSQNLLAHLISEGSGFVFSPQVKYSPRNTVTGLRKVILPLPDYIQAAARMNSTTHYVTNSVDPSTVQNKAGDLGNGRSLPFLPAAYVFRYQNATAAQISYNGTPVPGTQIGASAHLVFRVLMTKNKDATCYSCQTADPTGDADHANRVFAKLMSLLDFATGMPPSFSANRTCQGEQYEIPVGLWQEEFGAYGMCGTAPITHKSVKAVVPGGFTSTAVQLSNCGAGGGFVDGFTDG